MDTVAIEIQDQDMLLKKAARIIVRAQAGSTSLLQRIMVQLKTAGIVGEFSFDRPRDVLIKTEDDLHPIFRKIKNVQ